jgi:Beta-galactosidase
MLNRRHATAQSNILSVMCSTLPRRLTRTISALAALLLGSESVAAPADSRFVQDRFAIGFWVAPRTDENIEARYREIAEANFTFVIGLCGAKNPPPAEEQLKLCEKYDLKALIDIGAPPYGKLPNGPACWGYSVVDEPSASQFPVLRKTVDALRAARPGKLAYINLFPDYASPAQLGTKTYDEHVARFMSDVNPDVLSMDHYPIFKPDADGRDNYCRNLEVMRRESLKGGIPFWNFFNTMPYGPHTDPTEAQLRWQIFTSLAYGAKGVMYFCYWTPRGHEFPKGGAILTTDGRRTRHYDEAKRINAGLKNLGPTLMKLTSTYVHRVKPKGATPDALKESPVRQLSDGDYLVGVFRHADGRRAVLLNNYHFAYSAWPTVEFDVDSAQVVEVSPKTGREEPVRDDSPDMDGLQVSLDAGEGRLFLLPAR